MLAGILMVFKMSPPGKDAHVHTIWTIVNVWGTDPWTVCGWDGLQSSKQLEGVRVCWLNSLAKSSVPVQSVSTELVNGSAFDAVVMNWAQDLLDDKRAFIE